jgi:Ca-activated chloride channel family protein
MHKSILKPQAGNRPCFVHPLLVTVLLVIWQMLPASGAQRPPSPQVAAPDPGMVLARVTITGPRSKPLPRLGVEHLRVSEDGVEQQIEYFAFDSEPPSVAVIWAIQDELLSNDARLVPLDFLENLAQSAPPRSISARVTDLSRRQFANPLFEYFLIEGGVDALSPPTVVVAFSTEVKRLPQIFPRAAGSIDAVFVGLDVLKESAFSKKAVLMITDGVEPSLRGEYYKQYAIRQGVPVYCISAGSGGEGDLQLQELADVSGGEGYLATAGGAIENYALEVAQGLNNQYVIGYHPSNAVKNGKWRKLGVRVTPPAASPKLHARIKSGYYAPKQDR